jgi:hypothetical protein
MSSAASSLRAELEAHPRRDDLARLVRTVTVTAADEQRGRFADGLDELSSEADLSDEDGTVASFNVLKGLGRAEPPVVVGRTAVALLLAHGVSLDPPSDDEGWARLAERLTWLAANTWVDALWAIDDALDGDVAASLWQALGLLVRASDERGSPKGRAGALAAAVALGHSSHEAARDECTSLRNAVRDPLLRAAFEATSSSDAETVPFDATTRLSGEIVPTALGPVGLFLWTVTGLILFRYLFRFIANVVLRCKRPAELTVVRSGVTVDTKLDVLGRTMRERAIHIPQDNLALVVRETRHPRLAMYAGLLALALGTFIGASLVTDGGRAASPSMLALGAAVFGLGVALDLVFANLIPAGRGQYRLVFTPRKGKALTVATQDEGAADKAVRRLATS